MIGPRSDQYAIGAILYEMLTGRPPFKGSSIVETLDQVRTKDPAAPTLLQPNVPKDLETICLKCLEKDPDARYVDVAALAEDLERFLDDRPILARPISRFEHLRRWCRRNKPEAVLIGLTASLLIAVTVVSVVAALVIHEKNHEITKKNDDLTQAYIAEREARQAADEQANNGLSVIQSLVTKVQQQLRNRTGDLQNLRLDLLRTAGENLSMVLPSANRLARMDRTEAARQQRLGDLLVELGRYDEAVRTTGRWIRFSRHWCRPTRRTST